MLFRPPVGAITLCTGTKSSESAAADAGSRDSAASGWYPFTILGYRSPPLGGKTIPGIGSTGDEGGAGGIDVGRRNTASR